MRIAHISDLHLARSPAFSEYNVKRLLGYANHRLFRGRRHREQVAVEAVGTLLDNPPDLALLTGDITQHGLDAEFDAAAKLLSPIVKAGVPILALAGNHDLYGRTGGERARALVRELAGGLEPDESGLFRFPGLELLPLHQAVPTPPFFSSGRVDPDELARAGTAWAEPPRAVMRLAFGHYPVIDYRGGPLLYFRGLRGAEGLIRFCGAHRVSGYFCGHNHKRFTAAMPGGCTQFAAPSLSSAEGAGREWISVYRCGPELDVPRDEAEPRINA